MIPIQCPNRQLDLTCLYGKPCETDAQAPAYCPLSPEAIVSLLRQCPSGINIVQLAKEFEVSIHVMQKIMVEYERKRWWCDIGKWRAYAIEAKENFNVVVAMPMRNAVFTFDDGMSAYSKEKAAP